MRNISSSWTLSVRLALACGLASVLLRPTSAGEPHNTRGTRVAPPDLLAGCGRDDPFAPLPRTKPSSQPKPLMTENHQQAPGHGPTLEPLSLNGIVWSQALPQAIINDTLVGIGESVAGRTVVSIGRDRVVLAADGNQVTLELSAATLRLTGRRVAREE